MQRRRFALLAWVLLVLAAAVPSTAWAVDKICLDFAGIDARTDLTAEQKTDLETKIKQVAQANLGDDYKVVSGTACENAKRTIHFVKDAHNPDDRWGDWASGATDAYVYVGGFMDDANVSSNFKTGTDWDTTKLANGLGETGCHECGHSYSVGHNKHDPPDKMTDGSLVTPAQRAAGGRHFDDPAKKVLKENLGKDPCKIATDYDEKAVLSYAYDLVPLGSAKEEDGFDGTSRFVNASLTIAGALPGYFFGYVAGSAAAPYFAAKSSLDPLYFMPYLTWFQFSPNQVSLTSFVIAPAGGATWEHPDATNFGNPVTYAGHVIFRTLTLTWFSRGVTIMLNAAADSPGARNGWGPRCMSPLDCNDGNPCTADSCDPSLGCHHDPGPGLSCSDGVPCHQVGRCDPAAPGADPLTGCYFPDNCEQSDPCLAGACDPSLGMCVYSPKPPPTEVAINSLRLPTLTTLSWSPAPWAALYEMVRGQLVSLPVGPSGGDESCFGGLTDPFVADASTPPPGQGFWYLVRATNGCTAGPYGMATSGPRATATCDHEPHYRDEVDAGNDPIFGGCHYSFADSSCGPSGKAFYSADRCAPSGKLVEWIDTSCHPGEGDVAIVDCDQVCLDLGGNYGECVAPKDDPPCPLQGWIPARCVCH